MPMNEIDAIAEQQDRRAEVGVRHVQPEHRRDDAEDQRRADEPVAIAKRPIPIRCTGRESGAMNVYSIVPSQRSHATVSVRISKMIPR